MPQISDSITAPLKRKFNSSRIIFWYDEKAEMRGEFESVELEGVEKIEVNGNEFGVKFRILRQQPNQNFLLYKAGPQPDDPDNWLLDVQLSHHVFRTDKVSQTLDDLGLPIEFRQILIDHDFFFNADGRKDKLQRVLKSSDTENLVKLKMLSVCAGSDARLDSVLETLLAEMVAESEHRDRFELVDKCNLTEFFWEQMKREFNYASDQPGLQDFVIELFKSCFAMGTDGEIRLGSEALVFLRRWMDSYSHRDAFEKHSHQCAEILRIDQQLENLELRQLIELDYFQSIDKKILSQLARDVVGKTISDGQCKQIIRGRKNTHWFDQFQHVYYSIEHASHFNHLLNHMQVNFDSMSEGVASYTGSLYMVDQTYRKFLFHYRQAGQHTLLGSLYEQVCNQYSNNFLLNMCDKWQNLVDKNEDWNVPNSTPQKQFFRRFVRPFLDKKRKIYVIISDGMRFEIGKELSERIKQENRFDAELDHVITGLPSYTQLGMASLLPNDEIEINADKTSSVNINGNSTQGTPNRDKILNAATGGKALAISADDILAKNTDECRELTREHDLMYVYHNVIDQAGHNQKTERQTFDATEKAIEDILKLIKKLTSANATNLIVTSDHGFIYQDEIEESDFSLAEPSGKKILNSDRRFVLGQQLEKTAGVNVYTPQQLGMSGTVQVMIPKSINRLRKKGSATRFVHGGCTLQETIAPVIKVRKGRNEDQHHVNIDLIPGGTNTISTGQLSVVFYQSEPVTEKMRPRTLRIGLYADDGMIISDEHEVTFDFETENAREREQKIRLVLSKSADAYNGQQVTLRLNEAVAGTSHLREYKQFVYTLKRSFTSDFDF